MHIAKAFIILVFFFLTKATAAVQLMNDSLKKVIISDITIIGNKVTKPHIITRELLFKIKDTLYVSDERFNKILLQSRNNVFNTSLFNFVDVTGMTNDSIHYRISINVTERVYTWPMPIFELADRNFTSWLEAKDWSRTNYGIYVTRNNFRGRNETVSLNLQGGFTENVSISYNLPYITKAQKDGLGFVVKYSRNHQMTYGAFENKLLFIKDFNKYLKKSTQIGIRYRYRQKIYNSHYINLYYNTVEIADTIAFLNKEYLTGSHTSQKFFTGEYLFERDRRNVKYYPLKGYYLFGSLAGSFNGKKDTFNIASLYLGVNRYREITPLWHYSLTVRGKLSLTPGLQPYYLQKGLGYGNDLVRGYDKYVVDGQHYALFRSVLKYTLVSQRILKIDWLKTEKLNTIPFAVYLNLFGDAGYTRDRYYYQNNPLNNKVLTGGGIGLDYVTYYDVVFRIEYSINQLGDKGIFLNFNAAF